MIKVDKYLSKKYDLRTYNCAHFVCEVWRECFGVDISAALLGLFDKTSGLSAFRGFRRLTTPVSPCLAVFNRSRSDLHVGIFYKGRVLHIGNAGVEYMPPYNIGFKTYRLRYYACPV